MGAIVYDDKDGPLIPMGSQSPSDIEISSGLFYLLIEFYFGMK